MQTIESLFYAFPTSHFLILQCAKLKESLTKLHQTQSYNVTY